MENLSEILKDSAFGLGACAVGISTVETLQGGPPSTDLAYVLPDAKSAVTFALALDQDYIESYLKKEDHSSHNRNNLEINTIASGLALEMANFLEMKGVTAKALTANLAYRNDTPHGVLDEIPPISHRYLAVRSGIGHFGYSGNVIRKDAGAAIILGSVVTTAELEPTEPLPPEDNYCDNCRLCTAACPSSFMSVKEKSTVSLGSIEFSYSKRRHHNRCDYVCGGFAGLHKSGKWSTWSPSRFSIPDNDSDFFNAIIRAADPYRKRSRSKRVFHHFLMPGYKTEFTCSHCQLICHPEREERERRYRMLTESGVVIQYEDGTLRAVTPDEAREHLEEMEPERRALYEDI